MSKINEDNLQILIAVNDSHLLFVCHLVEIDIHFSHFL